jgi:hypothetical protein
LHPMQVRYQAALRPEDLDYSMIFHHSSNSRIDSNASRNCCTACGLAF